MPGLSGEGLYEVEDVDEDVPEARVQGSRCQDGWARGQGGGGGRLEELLNIIFIVSFLNAKLNIFFCKGKHCLLLEKMTQMASNYKLSKYFNQMFKILVFGVEWDGVVNWFDLYFFR